MNRPIGVFDSGIGGLTVVKSLKQELPNESIVYFGDTARVPYGSKSKDIIRRYAIESARFLMQYDIKFMVVACNTTSAVALESIREFYHNPVVGMIHPGAVYAAETSRNKNIGIIGTKATISSNSYSHEISYIDSSIKVYSKACPLFVPLVEECMIQGDIVDRIAHYYLDSLVEQGIDTLVMGCTHYPLLFDAIRNCVGPEINLIDSGYAAARSVKKILNEMNLTNKTGIQPIYKFYVSDAVQDFSRNASFFLGHEMKNIEKIDLEDRVGI